MHQQNETGYTISGSYLSISNAIFMPNFENTKKVDNSQIKLKIMRKKIKLYEFTANMMSAFFTDCKNAIPYHFYIEFFIILRCEVRAVSSTFLSTFSKRNCLQRPNLKRVLK